MRMLRMSAGSGAKSSPRLSACTGVSASTNNVSCSSYASCSAPPPRCPTASSSSTANAKSSGSTGWPRVSSTCAARPTWACALRTCCASPNLLTTLRCKTTPTLLSSVPPPPRTVTSRCRWCLTAMASSCCLSVTFPARCGWKRCVATSLRTPLTVISGYLETLSQDPALDRDLQGPVAEMRRQAERMTGIIRDLLALSRLEETDEVVGGEPLDVGALISMLRKDVLARASHPSDVRARVESDAQLLGDEPEIHSAFSNLVDNAAKYTPLEGSIEMRWWVDEEGAHFSVTDTGMGIPAEHIPRLTERFYRVDAGRSRSTGGSGLGLAIVKHVLQRHGAELEVQS